DGGGVSYPRLVLDLDRAQRGEQLLDQVVLFVVQGGAAEAGEPEGPPGPVAVHVPLPAVPAGGQDPVGDHVHRRIQVKVLKFGAERAAVSHLVYPRASRGELQAGRSLGTQAAAAPRPRRSGPVSCRYTGHDPIRRLDPMAPHYRPRESLNAGAGPCPWWSSRRGPP